MNNKNIGMVLAILGIVVIGGVVVYASTTKQTEQQTNTAVESEKIQNGAMTDDKVPDDKMESDKMEKDKLAGDKMSSDASIELAGSYKDYSPALIESEQKLGKKVVLFFHAPWCPFCKTADTAFKENMSKIPAGVTVLKTDYDSNDALKTKYGVVYQHTFVQIDAQGNLVTKWNSGDIDLLTKNVK